MMISIHPVELIKGKLDTKKLSKMESGSLMIDKKSELIDSSRGALYCTYIVAKPGC